ncbi:MAG TPA: chromate efflux transporter [Polyangiaceae bacterium]|nr:chromate efflux transporter [Polyangiaceae bacterium]
MRADGTCDSGRGAPATAARASRPGSVREVFAAFLKLGCTSFGGPVAHLAYFRAELVAKRRWVSDERYADLVALCQFLPGPASSQVVFGLGMQRAGLGGALAASLAFTLPSALLMIACGYGLALAGSGGAGWLHGLKLAAVVVVAQAVWGMGKQLCPDRARRLLALGAAALLLAAPGAAVQIAVLAAGALIGRWRYGTELDLGEPPGAERAPAGRVAGGVALLVFAALLVLLPALAARWPASALAPFDSFYRSGALVFGGGHVVLPLLRAELVPRGWVSDDQFLAGYGAAQALPGPLFTFAAYLGTVMRPGPGAWQHGLWCLLGVFLPAWLLIGGALPFWHRLRAQRGVRAALAGANAAVVGVLLATLYSPVFVEGVRRAPDAAAALVGFALLEPGRVPPWAMVLLMAAAGQWVLPH